MKKSTFPFILTILAIAVFSGNCKKDNSTQPKVQVTDTVDASLQTDSGSIGLIINTRPMARKGYHPDHACVNISGEMAGFSRTIAIDPKTYLAVLRYDTDSLSDSEITGFRNGVDMDIKVYDASQHIFGDTTLSNQIVDPSDYTIDIRTTLPAINPPGLLNGDVPYIVQSQDDGKVMSIADYNRGMPGTQPVITSDYSLQDNQNQQFYFRHVQGEADSVYCLTSYRGYLMDFTFLGDFV